MSRLAARLKAVERQARRDTAAGAPAALWYQDASGADRFASPQHPGEVLTAAQLASRPEPAGAVRIVVHRVEAAPDAKRATDVRGER